MSPHSKIGELSFRRSELHHRNDIAGAIPLQKEILRLLEERGEPAKDIANAHNYLSVLYTKSGDFQLAETHARRALELHGGGTTPKDRDRLACYCMMLAHILELLGRRAEAIPLAEIAVKEWAAVHGPESDFVKARYDEMIALRSGTWKNVFAK